MPAAEQIAVGLEPAHLVGHDQQVRQRDLDPGSIRDHDPLVLIPRPNAQQDALGWSSPAAPEHLHDVGYRDHDIAGDDLPPAHHRRDRRDDVEPSDRSPAAMSASEQSQRAAASCNVR